MRTSFLLFLLLGTATGQTTAPFVPSDHLEMNAVGVLNLPTCEDPVKFGKTTKLIKDLFPEECLELPSSATISNVHAIDDLGRHCYAQDQHSPTTDPPADVPAIKVPDNPYIIQGDELFGISEKNCPHWHRAKWIHVNGQTNKLGPFCEVPIDRPTCDDKTRILQHDEQNPPTYWCHKVQAK